LGNQKIDIYKCPKSGFTEKVLEKRKMCDYPLLGKVEQNFDNFVGKSGAKF
jgi:hypothetical protein